jgi:hypothetical protein
MVLKTSRMPLFACSIGYEFVGTTVILIDGDLSGPFLFGKGEFIFN